MSVPFYLPANRKDGGYWVSIGEYITYTNAIEEHKAAISKRIGKPCNWRYKARHTTLFDTLVCTYDPAGTN